MTALAFIAGAVFAVFAALLGAVGWLRWEVLLLLLLPRWRCWLLQLRLSSPLLLPY